MTVQTSQPYLRTSSGNIPVVSSEPLQTQNMDFYFDTSTNFDNPDVEACNRRVREFGQRAKLYNQFVNESGQRVDHFNQKRPKDGWDALGAVVMGEVDLLAKERESIEEEQIKLQLEKHNLDAERESIEANVDMINNNRILLELTQFCRFGLDVVSPTLPSLVKQEFSLAGTQRKVVVLNTASVQIWGARAVAGLGFISYLASKILH